MLAGQIAASISIFMIRASQLAPGYLAAYRLFLSFIVMLPLFVRDMKTLRLQQSRVAGVMRHLIRHCLLPGVLLGIHFILWNRAASLTLAANASLLVNMVPLFMPILIFLMTGERPLWQELLATIIALGGVVILTFGDLSLGQDHLAGDVYAFVSMLFFASYLALSRRNKALPFWYYMGGVYAFGGITAFISSLMEGVPLWTERGLVEVLPLLGLVLVPTLMGHNLINRAMRRIPSQLVSVGQLSQVFWAGLIARFLYGEIPRVSFYLAIGLILLAMVMIISVHTNKKGGANINKEADTKEETSIKRNTNASNMS